MSALFSLNLIAKHAGIIWFTLFSSMLFCLSGWAADSFIPLTLLSLILFQIKNPIRGCLNKTLYAITGIYCSWILLQAGLHYGALNSLEPGSYITAGRKMVGWGLITVVDGAQGLLFFPLLLLLAINMWCRVPTAHKLMQLIPILFLPSMVMAIIQSYFDINLLNPWQRVWPDRVPGLGSDVNGFGISLFLVFPLCLYGVVNLKAGHQRWGFAALIIVSIWCMALSGSRTAFLGIVLVLLVWACLWLSFKKDPPKKRVRPIFFTGVVLTTIAVLLIVFTSTGKNAPTTVLYERLKQSYDNLSDHSDPKKVSSRWELGVQALRLVAAAPLAGWGPGGFQRNLDNVRYQHGEKPAFIDNAENHYLQIAADLGLPGLGLNLLLYLWPIGMVYSVRKQITDPQERSLTQLCVAVIIILLALFLTGPHMAAPEVAWLAAIYLGYLYAVGFRYGVKPPLRLSWPLIATTGIVITVGVFWGAYAHSFGSRGYKATIAASWWPLKHDYGHYYPYTRSEMHGTMVWLRPKAHATTYASSDVFGLKFLAHPANSQGPRGQRFELYLNDVLLERFHFFNGGERKRVYYFPHLKGTEMRLKFYSDQSFRPSDINGKDDRLLAIARTRIKFYPNVPSMGIGFYEDSSQALTALLSKPPAGMTIRWTGMRASIPVSKRMYRRGALWVACIHPEVQKRPLNLSLYVDDRLLVKKALTNHAWRKIPFNGDHQVLTGSVMTFQVDRTWNPKLYGISDTALDLGIAVALPPKKAKG